MKYVNYLSFVAAVILISACKPKTTDASMSPGDMNPERFVVVGGANMGGFMDDALFEEGQQTSLGNLLAGQLQKVGLSEFIQPLMVSDIGCNDQGKSKLVLGYKTDCLGVSSLSPIRFASIGDQASFNAVFSPTHHNYGIPGLKASSLWNAGYASENPYFFRLSSNPLTDRVASKIVATNPTFFAVMLGIDDVLDFAKKGASLGSMTPLNDPNGNGFTENVTQLVDSLTINGAKGVISTVPDVTDLPYFTTIPYNGLTLTAEKAASLNQIYNPIGITFSVGSNPFIIEDPNSGTFGVRKMVEGEYVLLSTPLDSVKCNQMGSVFPFRDEFVLTLDEINQIRTRTAQYNTAIEQLASTYNLALVDTYSFYKKLKSGLMYNGVKLSLTFVSGGTVSLDGLNFTPRGNAVLANEFIKSINKKYQSTIPLLNATSYRGTRFP
jgi:hypothetical protein